MVSPLAALIPGLLSLLAPYAASVEADPEALLVAKGYMKIADRALLDRGGIVAKVLDTPDRSEIRTLVVLRIAASPVQFKQCVHDPRCFHRAGDLLAAGTFGRTPSLNDLEQVVLDDKELRYLAACRVGDCDLRMSAADITRFRSDIDWKAPDQRVQVERVFREMLLRYARSYLQSGNDALPTYADGRVPVNGRDSLQPLLERGSPVSEAAPQLLPCLFSVPSPPCPGADLFMSWYKEKIWKETVISLSHLAIAEDNDSTADRVFVVSKQVFASNYYNSSLEWAEYVRAHGAARGTLVYLSYARMDAGPNGFNAVERFLLRRLIPPGLKNWVRSLEQNLDQRARAHASPVPVQPPRQ